MVQVTSRGVKLREYFCKNCHRAFLSDFAPEKCPKCKNGAWNGFEYTCNVCEYGWLSNNERPTRCPKCRSRAWNDPVDGLPLPGQRLESNEELLERAQEKFGTTKLRIEFLVRAENGRYRSLRGEALTVQLRSPGLALAIRKRVEQMLNQWE